MNNLITTEVIEELKILINNYHSIISFTHLKAEQWEEILYKALLKVYPNTYWDAYNHTPGYYM